MKRVAFTPALALLCGAFSLLLVPSPAYSQQAQATAAAPTTAAPAAKAKYYRPVKGLARIEMIEVPAKQVGKDVVSVLKIKNVSTGRIDLLQVDQYWYDKSLKEVTGTTEKYRKPFNPGDVIELTLKSPIKPNLYRHQLMFTHINGKIDVKRVDKFK